ncbi:MAG: molybdopterin-binding protein [Burkholderiaceae bacterium]
MSSTQRVTAAVLLIGNEILSGRTQDANLAHLAKTLNDYGIQVREARTVPDIEDEIIAALDALRTRYDYVFTTGGIGPTHDDITADCVAKAFGVPLVENEEIAQMLRKREAPPDIMAMRLRMARIPEGGDLIRNEFGPPGFCIGNVYVMAGIPRVMQSMLASLDGKLRRGETLVSLGINAYVPESHVAKPLGELQARYPHIDLGSYPFYRDEVYGTTLIIRGSDGPDLRAMYDELWQLVEHLGGQPKEELV